MSVRIRRTLTRVSWDLDVDEARELAEEYLSAMPPPDDDEWVVTRVEEREWGWIVSWLNRRAAEGSTSTSDTYAGGGPFLIDRETGRVARCGSAHPVDYYVSAWREGTYPDTP
ncbi:MAG TPA: YrhB domain-containing protein, partial [Marmoricola sp.]|nr:YrhB domain-containing protein [Marmoricola sp.]